MCGIAGILEFDRDRAPDLELLSRMTGALAHRGPDDQGFYHQGPAALGHRRLSIVDLAGGTQPMANEDGSVWIVFNGEIFNHADLRRELEAAGHVFRTRSDTESIVHLYEEHGPEGCARRLLGQFAFAIWDARRQLLCLARDQVGIKPLFYRATGDRLLFASELKAILEDDAGEREMDPEALLDFLSYRYIPAPRTIFKGIEKLPAGHLLVWEKGHLRKERFWRSPFAGEPPANGAPAGEPEEDAARRLADLLRDAVRRQLMSDVPLGAFLSGGIDSSIVVGLMASAMKEPVKTFTIGFREEKFSELPFARRVAERWKTEHHELIVEPESVEILPRLVRQLDEPFADASAIPTYYVSRMARETVTVALAGDGGDEAFGGYTRYQWALKYARYDQLPIPARGTLFRALAGCLRGSRWGTAARRLALDPASRYADLLGYTGGRQAAAFLAGDFQRLAAGRPDFAVIRDVAAGAAGADDLARLQHIDLETYLPDDILVKTDRMSMLNSLEVRVPLLDHRVLELAATFPPGWRLAKRILKKAAGELIPPELLERRKKGFSVPLRHWFRDDWNGYARDLLLGQRSRERGIFDHAAVDALIRAHVEGRRNATDSLFALVVLEEWCRQYLDLPQRTR
jgi:asparagine synthase (glutamine-hydrolysing)